jgi:DNA-binding response OmpR family regulator
MEDVALVPWPAGADELSALRAREVPRLLLVEEGPPPEVSHDVLEDWIRVPADPADIRARAMTLQLRWLGRDHDPPPTVDDFGVLRFGDGVAALPPVETRLANALIERYRAVVLRSALTRACWPDRVPCRNALDVHVLRLRRRLAPLGLQIVTVRARGYLLETTDSGQQKVAYG